VPPECESERGDRDEAAKLRGRIVHPGRRATQVAGRGVQDHRRKRRHTRGHAHSNQHKARSARTTPSTTTPSRSRTTSRHTSRGRWSGSEARLSRRHSLPPARR
jgi:hypothetical protein